MEEKAFRVWGSSFDLVNKEFLSDIDFKNGTHKIGNPADPARSFYFVAEFPHMLKLFRNHMFDKGFWFPKNPLDETFSKPSKRNFDALKSCGDWIPLNKSHFEHKKIRESTKCIGNSNHCISSKRQGPKLMYT